MGTAGVFTALIQQVALPELLAVIRAHFNATGQLPTDAQVIAALGTDTSRYEAIGNAFLASKGAPTT